MTMVALAGQGDNIIATKHYYHGAYNQFFFLLPEFGVEIRVVEETAEAFRAAIDGRTKAVYIETVGHPNFNVPDIQAIAKVAHDNGVPLVVENTVECAYFCQPIQHGADIVVASMSKWIGGHGSATGGIIVDSGNFDWKSSTRFPQFNKPCSGFHGPNFSERFGREAFIVRIRGQILRDAGGKLGRRVLDALVDAGFDVTVLVRRQSIPSSYPPGVRVREIDYDSVDSLREALRGIDAVVSTVGKRDGLESQFRLIDAAVMEEVTRFIPSEFGADLQQKEVRTFPTYRTKIEVEKYLEKKARETNLTYTFIYCSALFDEGVDLGAVADFQAKKVNFFDGGATTFNATRSVTVADAVVAILNKLEATKNKAVRIRDVSMTPKELLKATTFLESRTLRRMTSNRSRPVLGVWRWATRATLAEPVDPGRPPHITGSAMLIFAPTREDVLDRLKNDPLTKEGP
ncbi:Homocysteine synthase [Colletotrichum viniferum]|nr:Homocysteine synthase [Colletotrichum viniferum]